MSVDIHHLFNEHLPGALVRNAQDAHIINATFQLNIKGAGEWFIDTVSEPPSCVEGNPGNAECTLTMSASDFQKLYDNPQANGMSLYFARKLDVQGNPMLAMKLARLFSYK